MPASLRTIWGLAKSPELMLSSEDLHAIVYRETRKESMRLLTQSEIVHISNVLKNMQGGTRAARGQRTDVGGDPRTIRMRRKIYMLCEDLGWNNDNKRINGFVKKMCGVERVEWLTMGQCYQVIEALKKMLARQEARDGA